MPCDERTLTLTPIGVVHSPFKARVEAPRQPRAVAAPAEGTIELYAGRGFEDALSDLACWSHVWLLFWFDRNQGFTPKIQPPRSEQKRGVFATRAPYRPNPIGLSALRLLAVEGLTLRVAELDLLDQTPVLDLKPYVPYTDAIAGANHGWLERGVGQGAASASDPIAAFQVTFRDEARAQLAFLRSQGVELEDAIATQLALGPSPHAYRRIKRDGDLLRLGIKDFRAWFRVDGREVTVERIGSGYRARELATAPPVHAAFVARFGP